MRPLRIALAVVALASAVGALLLAHDVGRWEHRIAAGDRLRATRPGAAFDWTPSASLPFDPARSLVGLDGDIRLREAIRAYVVAARTGEGFDNGRERAVRKDAAEAALEEVVLSGSPSEVARADVLLGVIAFDAASTSVTAPGEQSVAAFTEAARLDPANAAAKFDLELALRALAPSATRAGSNPSSGGKGRGRRGAGAGLPGSGF